MSAKRKGEEKITVQWVEKRREGRKITARGKKKRGKKSYSEWKRKRRGRTMAVS